MNQAIKTLILFVIIVCIIVPVSASGKSEQKKAAAVYSKPDIEDGEFLVYGLYQGGEKTGDINMVTRIVDDKIILYYHIYQYGDFIAKMPENYTEYGVKIITPFNTGIMEEYSQDIEAFIKENDLKGMIYESMKIDQSAGEAKYLQKIWDGYETKSTSTRFKIDPGYPVFGLRTISFDNLRYFDLGKGGYAYFIIPEVLADPIFGTIAVVQKEKTKTDAGTFDTLKVTLSPGDMFIKKLLGPLSTAMVFWIEDGPKHRTIKSEIPGSNQTIVLEKINANWK